jgi:hypothetical protein
MSSDIPFVAYITKEPYFWAEKSKCVADCTKLFGEHLVNTIGSDGHGDCECDVGFTMHDDSCKSCSEIFTGCSECDFSDSPPQCLHCESDYFIINPAKDKCWPKFMNCEIPIRN